MTNPFLQQLKRLDKLAHLKDPESDHLRHSCLRQLRKTPLPKSRQLIKYFDYLLFLLAYPSTAEELQIAQKELTRIRLFLRKHRDEFKDWLQNSGLPYASITTQFSHDCIRWLTDHPLCKIEIDSFAEEGCKLHEVLNITLPSTERHIASTGMASNELMDTLLVPKRQRLKFIIQELARLDASPQIKDTLFDQLGMFVTVTPKGTGISRSSNRIPIDETWYHRELLKKVDHDQIVHSPLPKPVKLTKATKSRAIQVIKNTMLLTTRETDPCTYMDASSFRLYVLERGVSIAIYGMHAERQLPLESYVGFTVFKNGWPVSYGGAWVFGERANFGINVFEPYRNGESGYLLAQLLRVYVMVFGLRYIEVEPYQYGLDNPEGITSGAFWFYYKYGFRPVNKKLYQKAKIEAIRIKNKKGYRTSHAILRSFTESNICLKFSSKTPPSVPAVTSKITRMIQRVFEGDRALAEQTCVSKFKSNSGLKHIRPKARFALTEIALWACAANITDPRKLAIMAQMVQTKSHDLYTYQQLLLRFFSKN